MRQFLINVAMIVFFPIFLIDYCLSFSWIYRWLRGGHWERWYIGAPCHGTVWYRMDPERCSRITGERPGALERGRPHCEEHGKSYDNAVWCVCGRDLSRARGVYWSWEDGVERGSVALYSCPCGRWPRFLFGPPAPIYLGDAVPEADS